MRENRSPCTFFQLILLDIVVSGEGMEVSRES